MRNGSAGPSVQVRVHLPAFLGYIITVAILNWPILLHLNSHVVGRPFDDVFEGLWQIEWMKSALLERHISPLYTPAVFYPHGWTIASSAYPIWYSAVFSILAYGFGAVATYNTIQLGTFVISGFGVYLLVHYLTRNRLAGFLAGCVYISAPVLTLRLGGHLNLLLGTQWLPYAAWLTLAALDAPSSRKRWALLAGFALGLAILGPVVAWSLHRQWAFGAHACLSQGSGGPTGGLAESGGHTYIARMACGICLGERHISRGVPGGPERNSCAGRAMSCGFV